MNFKMRPCMRHRISIAGMTPKALDSRFRGNDGHKQKHGILAFTRMTSTSKALDSRFRGNDEHQQRHWIPLSRE